MSFRKLASGNWNMRVYAGLDASGKKLYKSFTGATKAECKRLASKWQAQAGAERRETMTVYEAMEAYVSLKEAVLSPSTVIGYQSVLRNRIQGRAIANVRIDELRTPAAQSWISDLARKYTAKTVRNAFGLLSATVEMFCPESRLRVTLPQRKQPELYCPSKEDVDRILDHARNKGDQDMVAAVLLAAFVPARRGEICALRHEDIRNGSVTISKSMVKTPEGYWETKAPKTTSSYRTVELPGFVLKELPKGRSGKLIRYDPDQLSNAFARYIRQAGLPHFRFHDLRHYGASMMLTVMSPRYVQDRGGWASGYTMHRVYDNVIDMERARQTAAAFEKMESEEKMARGMERNIESL